MLPLPFLFVGAAAAIWALVGWFEKEDKRTKKRADREKENVRLDRAIEALLKEGEWDAMEEAARKGGGGLAGERFREIERQKRKTAGNVYEFEKIKKNGRRSRRRSR